jgi:hypothetical protein
MFGFVVAGLACLAAESFGSTPAVIELRINRKSMSEQTGITCLPQEGADQYRLAFDGYGDLLLQAHVDRRGARFDVKDDAGVMAMVRAMVGDAVQLEGDELDVAVSTARLRFKCRSGSGGRVFAYGNIKFKGTVASGPDAGKAVKGKVTLKRVEISD